MTLSAPPDVLAERAPHVPEEPGHGEDHLDEHHVRDQDRRRGAEQRRDRGVGDGPACLRTTAPVRDALGARGAHPVLAHRLDRQAHVSRRIAAASGAPTTEPRHEHRAEEVPRVLQRRRVGVDLEEDRQLDEPERRLEQQQHAEREHVRRGAEEEHRGGLERARRARARPRSRTTARRRRRARPPRSRRPRAGTGRPTIPSSHIRRSAGSPSVRWKTRAVDVAPGPAEQALAAGRAPAAAGGSARRRRTPSARRCRPPTAAGARCTPSRRAILPLGRSGITSGAHPPVRRSHGRNRRRPNHQRASASTRSGG